MSEADQSRNHQVEQTIATLSDYLPRLWYSLFEQMQERGFDKGQAFDLLKTYVASH